MHRFWASFICILSCLVSAPAAGADPIAESLFQEALTLMRAGQFETACLRLEASQQTESKAGTLVVLASCHEQLGRLATAWAEYREAAALARKEGRPAVRKKALALAEAVHVRAPRVRVLVAEPNDDMVVTLDGKRLTEGSLGAALLVDPGQHVVSARVPRMHPFEQTFELEAETPTKHIEVPAWKPLEVPKPPPPAPLPDPEAPAPLPTRTRLVREPVPLWVWPVGTAGVLLGATSIAFLVDQHTQAAQIERRCGAARDLCPPDYDFRAAHDRELRGFALFVGAGVTSLGTLALAVWGVLDREEHPVQVALSPTRATVRVGF